MTTTRRTAICLTAASVGGVGALSACASTQDSEKKSAGARVATSDVPEGGGLVRDGVVVTQPRPGEFKAFDVRCPHQGCAVDQVTAEAIVCPCHGSQFALADGAVTQGPATEGLTPRTATVDGADVVVS
ncbi:iron-sulfur protein [Janibacter sp. Soil728]|uniref:Rieske (2Fe-2S) protein n=1 Tax=Janibacter sp. Soil728 TaxID=1736393 RepID=UPI0006FE043C|nr:Rieske (2Fe-2S) protein [Janibacter sp. Soil728]KRE37138.1 iron-sulfur protein [Janibacter sp. Soil728]